MSCYHPLVAYKDYANRVRFGEPPAIPEDKQFLYGKIESFTVPCGKCIGCRIDRSKEWALRMVLEAKCHEENSFITLTYDDEHLPKNGSLDFDELQRFFKRLRKKIGFEKIRYYAVGEYGKKLSRPHFHAIIFGFDFPDKWLWSHTGAGYLYRSPTLESVWGLGYSTVGAVSFESCAYCARYVQKKLYGADEVDLKAYYQGRVPEAARMSRRPGIARKFFDDNCGDFYPKDFITVKGVRYKPARYFDKLYKESHPEEFLQVKVKRLEKVLECVENNTPDRLAAREFLLSERTKKLVRAFEQQ